MLFWGGKFERCPQFTRKESSNEFSSQRTRPYFKLSHNLGDEQSLRTIEVLRKGDLVFDENWKDKRWCLWRKERSSWPKFGFNSQGFCEKKRYKLGYLALRIGFGHFWVSSNIRWDWLPRRSSHSTEHMARVDGLDWFSITKFEQIAPNLWECVRNRRHKNVQNQEKHISGISKRKQFRRSTQLVARSSRVRAYSLGRKQSKYSKNIEDYWNVDDYNRTNWRSSWVSYVCTRHFWTKRNVETVKRDQTKVENALKCNQIGSFNRLCLVGVDRDGSLGTPPKRRRRFLKWIKWLKWECWITATSTGKRRIAQVSCRE